MEENERERNPITIPRVFNGSKNGSVHVFYPENDRDCQYFVNRNSISARFMRKCDRGGYNMIEIFRKAAELKYPVFQHQRRLFFSLSPSLSSFAKREKKKKIFEVGITDIMCLRKKEIR